jgi:predicted MFS family arabinose efflux permease
MIDGAMGGGAFLGALFLASLKPEANLSRILAYNTLLFGIGLLLFSHTVSYPLALLPLAFGAFGMMSVVTITNTIIQVETPPEFRGRVISVFVMVLTGMLPIGSLLIGAISHAVGIQKTVLAEGAIAIVIAGLWGTYLRKRRQREEAVSKLTHPPETALETIK